jgi:hypothetical protein
LFVSHSQLLTMTPLLLNLQQNTKMRLSEYIPDAKLISM